MQESVDLPTVQNNLPKQLTRLIGRRTEIESVKKLLSAHCLVTLTGPGGTGKSRLALHVAEELLPEFPDGVFFIEFAPINDPAMVPFTIADTIGVQTTSTTPILNTLTDFLTDKEMLLILDNCEHLVSGCAEVSSVLLSRSSNVTIIATSREKLAVSGECPWLVPPLSVPQTERILAEQELTECESIELFLDRAALAKSGFVLSERDIPSVIEICRQLEGIPLAIELAASRISVLSPADIAKRLDERFRLLKSSSRSAHPRQQTLRTLVDWSFDLLTETERKAWSRLSVFAGTFSLEAAEYVVADDALDQWDVIDLLSRLEETSILMSVQTKDGLRYRMLETIRQYGEEKLNNAGALETTRLRFCNYYTGWCRLIRELYVANPTRLDLFTHSTKSERDNLLATLQLALAAQDAEAALSVAYVLGWYCFLQGDVAVGRQKLGEVLSLPKCTEYAETYCAVLNRAGILAAVDHDIQQAVEFLQEARTIGERSNLPLFDRLCTLDYLGQVMMYIDFSQAKGLFQEMLQRSDDHPYWTCRALLRAGSISVLEGDHFTFNRLFQQAEDLARDYQYHHELAEILHSRGTLSLHQHEWATALEFLTLSRDEWRKVGSVMNMVDSQIYSAFCEYQMGDSAKCGEHLEEALRTSVSHNVILKMHKYRLVAILLAEYGSYSTAVSLWNANQWDGLGPLLTWMKPYEETALSRAKKALGDEGYEAAVSMGKEKRLSQLTRQALADWQNTSALRIKVRSLSEASNREGSHASAHSLTERELAVLAMLARGYSNKRSADELHLSEGTVRTYLSRVYSKLGVTSRTEALLQAQQLGL